jgi:hypothetical protein
MNAFLKTVFGDRDTVAVVAVVMLAELLLVAAGSAALAGFAAPCFVLVGAGWLARR